YSPQTRYQNEVYNVQGLENKLHLLKIIVTGNSNSSSSGNRIRIDYLEITKENWINEDLNNLNNIKKDKVNADTPIYIPTYDNELQAIHPKVLYFPNSWNGYKYWMAFTPYTNSDIKTENPSIVASNADGYS